MSTPPTRLRVLARGSRTEVSRIAEVLRQETIGGVLLLAATVAALVWANTPLADSYAHVREFVLGPSVLHLDLSLATWAADGLLAIFFFVAGLELKREFVAGDLRDPSRAAVPVAAALGGVVVPAVLCTVVVALGNGSSLRGWAVPTATDIAFALAALAVIGTHLPSALRTFLLTLAVVDDLVAIVIIAVFYTADFVLWPLALAVVPLGLFTLLVQRRVRSWWLLLPLAVITWALVHASGVHATVAGVLLGFAVPVIRSRAAGGPDAGPGLAEHFEHRFRPLSAGVAVPLFALFSAGVTVGGFGGLRDAVSDPIALGVVVGLVVGKPVGVLAATWLVARFTRAELAPELSWTDVAGLAMLCGIGFTVSLLIGELAFGDGTATDDQVKIGVLVGSLVAGLLAAVVLRLRNRTYARLCAEEDSDDADGGIPRVDPR
ncbi:Na+/H+ antiporter NhaA [Jatrophihabitans sp. YIM 134969]